MKDRRNLLPQSYQRGVKKLKLQNKERNRQSRPPTHVGLARDVYPVSRDLNSVYKYIRYSVYILEPENRFSKTINIHSITNTRTCQVVCYSDTQNPTGTAMCTEKTRMLHCILFLLQRADCVPACVMFQEILCHFSVRGHEKATRIQRHTEKNP